MKLLKCIRLRHGLTAACALLVPLFASASGQPVRAFILAGQSNMAGSGSVAQAPAAWRPLGGVLFDETSPGNPGSASSAWEAIGSAAANMGPELSLAAALRDAYPTETIALVKVSQAGTGLGYWRTPGQAGHDTLMARIATIRDRLQAAVADGEIPSWSWAGFFWMQGENEADGALGPSTTWQNDFNDLATKVRAQTAEANLPIVLGRISIQLDPSLGGPVEQPQLDNVRAAQVAWATSDGRGAWVDTDDLSLVDAWHFGSYGQLALGMRFARAWFETFETKPLPWIRRAGSQPERSHASTLSFEVVFRDPFPGFPADDISVTGHTSARVEALSEVAPADGTVYRVSVSGMQRPGVVGLQIAGTAGHLPGITDGHAVLWCPHPAVTDLLAYDPIEPGGRPLHGLQSGVGWNGAGWSVQNSLTSGYRAMEAAPLSHSSLLTTPGSASGGDSYVTTARMLDLERTFAPHMASRTAGMVNRPGSVFWISYLIEPNNLSTPQRVALLRGSGTPYTNNTVTVDLASGTWQMTVLGETPVSTGVNAVNGRTDLLVLRMEIGGASAPSRAHLWINPMSLGGPAPALATAHAVTQVTSSSFGFSRLHWYPGNAPNSGKIDEIRIGTSYASVTPVQPQPMQPPAASIAISTSGQPVLSFFRARSDRTYTVFQSLDLGAWEPFVVNPGNVGEQVVVPLPTPDPLRFYRLGVAGE